MNLTPTRITTKATGKIHWTNTENANSTLCGQSVLGDADGQEVTCRRCLDYADAAKNRPTPTSIIQDVARVIAERIGVDTDLGDDTMITATLDGVTIGIEYAVRGVAHRVVLEINDPPPFSRFETATIEARARVAAADDQVSAVRAEIQARLQGGMWPSVVDLPSEKTIAELLGVTLSTVRKATTELKEDGVLYSRSGGRGSAGTFGTGAEPRKQTMREQIREEIRDDILSGRLKPGAVLPEMKRLADVFNCGPETVKRALGDLQSEGFLVTAPGSGTNQHRRFVADPLPETDHVKRR